ncbi:MAG: amidohydrolase [Clostridia bacterium]|nr:amidohydrolase [Clostridia bacterium]
MKVFINCQIITMDDKMPYGDYIVVDNGRIIEVGKGSIKPEYEGEKQIDLKGCVVIPGFWESHIHVATGVRSLIELNLKDCSYEQMRERIKSYCKKVPPGDWIIGHGWDERKLFGGEFPDRYILDELCSSNPMVLVRMDGHSLCLNTAAIYRLELNDPVGMFFENAAADILARIECLLPDNYIEKVILKAQDLFLQNGITSINDICIQYGRYLELYKKLEAEKRLKLRVTASPNGTDNNLAEEFENSRSNQNERLKIGPPKYFMDGSFGSRTGLLWEEYDDDPGNMGIQLYEKDELEQIISNNAAKGQSVNIHAIGDKAVSILIDVFDSTKHVKSSKPRNRIEHIQIIRDRDIKGFKKHSITASFQPVFLYEVDLTRERLGKERLSRVYRFKSFIDEGVNVIFNSDWPYGGEEFPKKPDGVKYIGFEPLLGIHAACCMQMNANEAVTPIQALKCYTVNPAYVNYREEELGKLKKGFFADFAVLSKDITKIKAEDIINTEVIETYISGEKVYEKKNP